MTVWSKASPPHSPTGQRPDRRQDGAAAVAWLRGVLVATIVLPVLLFSIASWDSYRTASREAERDLLQRAEIAREHAAKVFDSQKLIAQRISDRIAGLDDRAVSRAAGDLHAFLAEMKHDLPQVQNILIVGAGGHPLVSASDDPIPAGVDLSSRDYFAAARDEGRMFGISQVERGALSGRLFFGVTQRRTAPDGNFGGVILISVSPRFFIDFYTTLVGDSGDVITLMRADGEVLVRGPGGEDRPRPSTPGSNFFGAIADAPAGGVKRNVSMYDGPADQLFAYDRLPGSPVYAVVERPLLAIAAEWQGSVAGHLLFGIPATIALFLLTLTALRRTRREAEARAQAKDEMQRREAAEEDVLARKRIEVALRESEERLRTILESLPDIAFVQRPDGSSEYHNRRFYDYVGPVALNDGALRFKFHHPDDVPVVTKIRDKARAAGVEYAYDVRMRRHDGVYRWHAITVKPLHRDGKITGWLGTAVDIDDMRRANEILDSRVKERTRELAAANEHLVREMAERQAAEQALRLSEKLTAIGQLTGGVAHDFNNVLTAVLGNLELVERHLKDERLKRMVQSATRAAQRGAKLTEQLLAYARKQRLVPQAIDLNQMLGGGTADMLRRTLGGTVTVETDLAPGLWTALVDPTQIELMVLNLAINARDAMPEGAGGHIAISTRNVPRGDPGRPGDLADGDYVMFAVADNGSGMPQEVAAKAFEPFFTTKAPGKGSGLGLSQVYGVAQQLGGSVRLNTRVGEGTTIEVFLPRTEAAAQPAPAADPAAASVGRRASILVVDDEDDVREVAVAHLDALGYRTLTASNGAAALEIIAADKSIDLVLADYAMPGMTGADLARVARATRPDLPIIVVTGYADMAKLDEQLNGVLVIKKPYRQSELVSRIEATLARAAVSHDDLLSEAGQ